MNRMITFKPTKIFARNGRKFLYSVEDSALYEIDDNLEYAMTLGGNTINDILLNLVNKKNMSVEDATEMIQMIAEAGLIVDPNEDGNKKKHLDMNLSALTLMVCQECNMKCAYCYGEGGEYKNKGRMSKKTAFRAVDYLIENSKDDELGIAFLGGEPLMNFELIKEVVGYCSKKSNETGKKFKFTITTNGTLLTPEKEKFLIDNHIMTQISIDGTKEDHDSMRFFECKKPSYDVVVEKTKSMRDKGLVTSRATLSSKNVDYIKTFEHLEKLGFAGIPIEPAKNLLSEMDKEKEYEEFVKYAEYYKKQIEKKKFDRANKMTNFSKAMERVDYSGERQYGCGAFHTMYAVDIDGRLYPCHRFVGHHRFVVGSIFDDNKNSIEEWKNLNERARCSKCWMKNLCSGGCAYENFMGTGSINVSLPDFCKRMDTLYKTVIDVYIDNKYINS